MNTSGLQDLLYRIGYAAERLGNAGLSAASRAADAATETISEAAEGAGDTADDMMDEIGEHIPESLSAVAGTFAAGWIAKRLLQRREVNWPRAVLAGVIGTLLYDLEMAADQRIFRRKFNTIQPLGAAVADEPAAQTALGWTGHYAAGIGLAAFYARYLYGRLPGPPVAQGVAFGALDAATLSWGGVLPLLNRISPEVRLPLGYAGLSRSPEITVQTLLRHLAYGAGVGLVYRANGDAEYEDTFDDLVDD